jgi:hypothetical protein
MLDTVQGVYIVIELIGFIECKEGIHPETPISSRGSLFVLNHMM